MSSTLVLVCLPIMFSDWTILTIGDILFVFNKTNNKPLIGFAHANHYTAFANHNVVWGTGEANFYFKGSCWPVEVVSFQSKMFVCLFVGV